MKKRVLAVLLTNRCNLKCIYCGRNENKDNSCSKLEISANEWIEIFKDAIKGAKTVVWNGPLGVCEFSNYQKGTYEIAKAIAQLKDAYTVIGGGDSAAAIINLGLEKSFSHISTGGGASLCLLQGDKLPGIESIELKSKN